MASETDSDLITKADAQEALASLPSEGVVFSCAYGSRYLEGSKSSQLDLLVAVDSALLDQWHFQNVAKNPTHYFPSNIPSIAYGLATRVRRGYDLQDLNQRILTHMFFFQLQRRPPGAFFHTFVEHPAYNQKRASDMSLEEIGSQYWKYGVIGVEQLVEDLTTWNHLFIAGRLHKPVLDLDVSYFSHTAMDIKDARRQNLKAAAAAAMIILPQNFSELDLYYVISSLSYAGDIRLLLGAENPKKLENIIYKSPKALLRFRNHFAKTLESLEERGLLHRSRKPSSIGSPTDVSIFKFEQDLSMKPELLRSQLPDRVQDEIWKQAQSAADLDKCMKDYVIKTVRRSSTKQLFNNVLMNSPLKSSKYALAKLAKGLLRR